MYGKWRVFRHYPQFEQVALGCLMLMIAAISVFATVITFIKLTSDMLLGEAFLDKAALQDTFGLILIVVILLEFNHSLWISLTERLGAVQAKILVRITILVLTRKLMLMDFASVDMREMLGFAGLLLALGGLHWLISDSSRRQPAVPAPEEKSKQAAQQ